jgi:dihydroorotate dehydrogenase
MYKLLLRPFFFLFSAETAHHLALSLMKLVMRLPGKRWAFRKLYVVKDKRLERTVFGLTFPNPVGLAAGFDKDARYTDELACLGFSFVEVGTVTPRPQDGNPRPRLFRLPVDGALINRMGFNNEGVAAAAIRLAHRKGKIIIGGNIGKNKTTPNEEAIHDYLACFDALAGVVDYFVVNVSSPNTPGLRELQEKEPLTKLLQALQARNAQLDTRKPILLKIAPDLTDSQLDDIIAIVQETQLDGIVATNTTISRQGLHTPATRLEAIGAGGLSGKPVQQRSTEVVRYIAQKTGGQLPIIAVGGIFTAADAREKLEAGASLVQVYTGFIYEGMGLAKNICKGLLK